MTALTDVLRDDVERAVREGVDAIERDRRLPVEVVDAIRDTGLHRMAVPTELGGDEAPPSRMAEIIERIAAVDGSAGWCAAVGAGTNIFSGYVERAAAASIWADPDTGNASMFGPFGRVERDGADVVLRGRWPFVSNCLHATWLGLGAASTSIEPGPPRLYFIPAGQATVIDTWDVRGLRGTGSHDITVNGVCISGDHSCSFADSPWPAGTLWQLPLFTVLAPPLAAAPLGIAAAALAGVTRMLEEDLVTARGALVDDLVALADLASARAALAGARAALFDSMNDLWARAAAGDGILSSDRARSLLTAQYAVDTAVEVTSTVHRLIGSAAVYRGHPVGRAMADVLTARQHIMFSHHLRPALAKALAGGEVSAPPFL